MSFGRWFRDIALTVATLAGLAGLICAGWLVLGANVCHQTKADRAQLEVRYLGQAIGLHTRRTGRCPSGDVVRALVDAGRLERIPLDPWERPYRVTSTDGGFEVISLGLDGQVGGTGQDADLRQTVRCPGEDGSVQ